MIRLLDTNACIQLWQRKNQKVRERFKRFSPSEIALCSVVKAELLFGARKSSYVEANLELLEKLFAPLGSYDFDDKAAIQYGKVRAELSVAGMLIGANDLLIASIALANGLTLVTNNIDEFSRVDGLALEDWEA